MKKLKFTSIILSITIIMSVFLSVLPVNAADGYKEGDVIFINYSDLPEWYDESTLSYLYINFTNNTRYDSGEKENVIIGQDTTRFNPKVVTEKVNNYVYKYIVTAEDAGASTLMFWRGNKTNLWNNSVELTYSDYCSGKNEVVVTDWTNTGYTTSASYFDYDIKATLTVSPESGKIGDKFTVKLDYEKPVNANVTYKYEITYNNTKVSDTNSYTFTANQLSNRFSGTVTAYYQDGTIAAQNTANKYLYLGDFNIVNSDDNMLYAHAFTDNGIDTESWVKWAYKSGVYTFYLPSSADTEEIELYSTFASEITVGGTTIKPYTPTVIKYAESTTSTAKINGTSYKLKFKNSTSEAALFVNNDHSKTDNLWEYLSEAKSNSSSATASIVDRDGEYESASIKKIKGRGNTTWNNSDKKPFNINFSSAVTVGTMQSTKKYSLLANFQDPSMSRNRILYDLGDAVDLKYSSDSRFVDFYVDGVYKGQYQMCQKIEAGKKNLVTGVDDDGYLTDDKQLKDDFGFIIEVPYADDFYTTSTSGIQVNIKSPDVEGNDNLYAEEVKSYVREKFDAMYKALATNDKNLNDYIDIDSLAICYIIQELGKNWDSSSWYFVYEEDENGQFKFYASPVWDFDNAIGNAAGVESELQKINVNDYTEYSGWWCKYKEATAINFSYLCTENELVMKRSKTIWFERFVPAINLFASENINDGEIFSADVYYESLYKSADMNYSIWGMTVDNGWIANHTKLYTAEFDLSTLTYTVDNVATNYNQYTFSGQFNYMADWLTSRAAWISNEWKDSYISQNEILLGDVNKDSIVNINDSTDIQKYIIGISVNVFDTVAADVDENSVVNIKDATEIQKYLTGMYDNSKIGTYIKV